MVPGLIPKCHIWACAIACLPQRNVRVTAIGLFDMGKNEILFLEAIEIAGFGAKL